MLCPCFSFVQGYDDIPKETVDPDAKKVSTCVRLSCLHGACKLLSLRAKSSPGTFFIGGSRFVLCYKN